MHLAQIQITKKITFRVFTVRYHTLPTKHLKNNNQLQTGLFTYPNPRQGVPRPTEAFVLCPAVLQPLPFRDGHGSYLAVSIAPLTRPALPTPILQASSRRSTSCLSRQPHKACCCHSPLRSLTGVANANELPQLLFRSAA